MTHATTTARDEARQPAEPAETKLFVEGDVLYAAMLASIRSARIAIRMESYIFAGDEVGQSFAEALAEMAQVGVDVRLHLDAVAHKAGCRDRYCGCFGSKACV